MALGAVIVLIVALLPTRGPRTALAPVHREPVRTAGDNPFMPTVGQDQPDVAPPAGSGGGFTGSTPGLYGGTLNNASCDPQQLVNFLQANPDKGTAWAGVLGIPASGIAGYVADLTPVILRADTAVTNHGFASGHATELQSVLQAGTAVLVDRYGSPVARCYCGNPLTRAASYTQARYTGTSWSGFSPATTVTVAPAPAPITVFTLVDPATNVAFERPSGTTGRQDRTTKTTPSPSPSPSPSASSASGTEAITLVKARLSKCSGVRFPFEQDVTEDFSFATTETAGIFLVTITGHPASGKTQIFQWQVDVAGNQLTPVGSLATTAAQYCTALTG